MKKSEQLKKEREVNAIEGHTPLPWAMEESCNCISVGPLHADGRVFKTVVYYDLDGVSDAIAAYTKADATLIVRAVNSHAEMVEALETFVAEAESFHNFHHGSTTVDCDTLCDAIAPAKAALAKAKGEQ